MKLDSFLPSAVPHGIAQTSHSYSGYLPFYNPLSSVPSAIDLITPRLLPAYLEFSLSLPPILNSASPFQILNSANGMQAEKHWLLLTVIITSSVLSLFACTYYLTRLVSCNCFRRFRGWRRVRRASDGRRMSDTRRTTDTIEIFRDDVDKDWLELDVTEKGARSPHRQ